MIEKNVSNFVAANSRMDFYSNEYKLRFKNDIPNSNPDILQVQDRSSRYVLNKFEEFLNPILKRVKDDRPVNRIFNSFSRQKASGV